MKVNVEGASAPVPRSTAAYRWAPHAVNAQSSPLCAVHSWARSSTGYLKGLADLRPASDPHDAQPPAWPPPSSVSGAAWRGRSGCMLAGHLSTASSIAPPLQSSRLLPPDATSADATHVTASPPTYLYPHCYSLLSVCRPIARTMLNASYRYTPTPVRSVLLIHAYALSGTRGAGS